MPSKGNKYLYQILKAILLLQVVNFIDDASSMCLSIENQASCQSSQPNASSTIIRPLSTVCVWQNAFLQTCWSGGSDAAGDQQWIYDNTTKLIALATDTAQNVCLEMCTDESFARGSCSLTDNNVGTTCTNETCTIRLAH